MVDHLGIYMKPERIRATSHVIGVYNGRVISGDAWCEKFVNVSWSPRFLIRRHPRRSPGAWPLRRRYPYDWAVQGL